MSDDRRPDWNYWKNVPNWTILEAVALSMDIDPKLVNYRTYRPLYGKEVTKRDESPEFEKRLSLAIENIENLAVKAVAGEYEKWKITRASFSALTRSLKWKVPPQMKARAEPDKREVEILNLKQQVEALTLDRDKLPVDVPIKKSKKRSEAAIERHSKCPRTYPCGGTCDHLHCGSGVVHKKHRSNHYCLKVGGACRRHSCELRKGRTGREDS